MQALPLTVTTWSCQAGNEKSGLSEELSQYPLIKDEMSEKGGIEGGKDFTFLNGIKVKTVFTNPIHSAKMSAPHDWNR